MTSRATAIAFALCALSASVAAQPAPVAQRPGQGPSQPGSQGDKPKPLSFMGFVVSNAYAAGAVGACEAPSALVIRNCMEGIIPQWARITGQEAPSPEQVAAVPVIWKDAYDKANAKQVNDPPMPCATVMQRARDLAIWSVCPTPWR